MFLFCTIFWRAPKEAIVAAIRVGADGDVGSGLLPSGPKSRNGRRITGAGRHAVTGGVPPPVNSAHNRWITGGGPPVKNGAEMGRDGQPAGMAKYIPRMTSPVPSPISAKATNTRHTDHAGHHRSRQLCRHAHPLC